MIKVLMILTTPFSKYGIGTVVKNYTYVLRKEVIFDFLLCRGIDDENVKYVKSINGSIWEIRSEREKNPLKYIRETTRFIKSKKYDVVHIHGNSSTMFFDALASKLAGTRIIIAHSHSSYTDFPMLHYMLKPLLNVMITRGIACSDLAGKWCFYKYEVLNNAIKTLRFKYSSEKRAILRDYYGVLDSEYVLLSVGHLDSGKNHKYIINLISRLKNIYNINPKLFIVGDGILRDELEQQITDEGLNENILLVGAQNNVEDYYSMADIFLFPSLYEGLGLVLLEAQASGLKCVASQGVPKQVDVSQMVSFVSLQNEREWLEIIADGYNHRNRDDRDLVSNHCCSLLEQNGYDISTAAKKLLSLYT